MEYKRKSSIAGQPRGISILLSIVQGFRSGGRSQARKINEVREVEEAAKYYIVIVAGCKLTAGGGIELCVEIRIHMQSQKENSMRLM